MNPRTARVVNCKNRIEIKRVFILRKRVNSNKGKKSKELKYSKNGRKERE